jgi:hypothetical protein
LDISGSPSVNGSTAGPLLHCRVAPAGRRLSSSLRMAAGSRARGVKAQEHASNNVRMDHASLQRIVTRQSGAREGVHSGEGLQHRERVVPGLPGPWKGGSRNAGAPARSFSVTA